MGKYKNRRTGSGTRSPKNSYRIGWGDGRPMICKCCGNDARNDCLNDGREKEIYDALEYMLDVFERCEAGYPPEIELRFLAIDKAKYAIKSWQEFHGR